MSEFCETNSRMEGIFPFLGSILFDKQSKKRQQQQQESSSSSMASSSSSSSAITPPPKALPKPLPKPLRNQQGFISEPYARQCPSPTLYEMMTEEQAREASACSSLDARNRALEERVLGFLARGPFGKGGDVRLTVGGREGGFRVAVDVHRRVLAGKSRYFEERLRKTGVQGS